MAFIEDIIVGPIGVRITNIATGLGAIIKATSIRAAIRSVTTAMGIHPTPPGIPRWG